MTGDRSYLKRGLLVNNPQKFFKRISNFLLENLCFVRNNEVMIAVNSSAGGKGGADGSPLCFPALKFQLELLLYQNK